MLRKEIKRKMKRGMDRMAELEGFLDRLLGELGECKVLGWISERARKVVKEWEDKEHHFAKLRCPDSTLR